MKIKLVFLILFMDFLIVSCGRTENSGTKDDALDVVSDNELIQHN